MFQTSESMENTSMKPLIGIILMSLTATLKMSACKKIPSWKITNSMTTGAKANAIETICLLFPTGGTIDYNCKLMNRGGMYILNIERAIFKDKEEAGVGLVIRVAQGLLTAVMSKKSLCMNSTKLK